jgi:hypothetical protein
MPRSFRALVRSGPYDGLDRGFLSDALQPLPGLADSPGVAQCRYRSDLPQKCRLNFPQARGEARPPGASPGRSGGGPIIDAVPSGGRGRDGDQAWGSRHDLGSASPRPFRFGHRPSARHRSQDGARKYLARGLEAPVYGPRQPRPRRIDPFVPYLRERVGAWPGLTGRRLFRELKERGYQGGYTAVTDALRELRPSATPVFEVRFETPPGDQAQVDFAQFQVAFADEPGVTRIVWAADRARASNGGSSCR